MNDRQLRTFIDTADCQSFSKAAAKSYVSTPALIKQINILEKDTGLQLFVRGARGITLTEEGEAFYQAAIQMLQIYDETIENCKRKKELQSIHINNNLTLFEKDVINFLMQFKNEHPECSFQLHKEDYVETLKKIEVNPSCILISMELKDSMMGNLKFIPFLRDTFSFLLTANHPLAKKAHLELEDFKKYKIVIRLVENRKASISEMIDAGFEMEVREPESIMSDFINDLLGDCIIAVPSVCAKYFEELLDVKTFETGLDAGRYGVIISSEADRETLNFVDGLVKYIGEMAKA